MSKISESEKQECQIITIFIFLILIVTEIYFGVLNIYLIIGNFILAIISYICLYDNKEKENIKKEFEEKIQRMKYEREESLSEIRNQKFK